MLVTHLRRTVPVVAVALLTVLATPAGANPTAPAELAAREYQASRNQYGLQAPNRAHNLRTYFDPAGVRVVDRTAPGAPGLVDLRLVAIGRGPETMPVADGEVTSVGSRVEIRRGPDLVEWYVNSPVGLEQGFTLATSVPGNGPVVLGLAVGAAKVAVEEGRVILVAPSGRRLHYGKLEVRDAAGATIPARLEAPNPETVRIVVDDAGARYPLTIDPLLTGTADAVIEANLANADLGVSVAGAGDVNGDGYADVIVGAPGYDGGANGGAAFVYLGGPSGIASGSPATASATLSSAQAFARFGSGVAGAGDVNGDGYGDVIVGASDFDAGSTNEGGAFVFLGGASGIASADHTTAAATLESNQAGAKLGWSVAGAGDVNGDGYADVIAGAFSYDAGESNEGAAFVFHGSASGIASGNPATAAATIQADQADANLGFSVSSAGDVNGDGYADVIVGAYLYDNFHFFDGAAFVFHGSATGVPSGSPSSASTSLLVPEVGANFGFSVAAAGDVNADGFGDVIVGAPFLDSVLGDEGAAFVFMGSASGISATAGAIVVSDQLGGFLGFGVAGAGDVNGDGYADVVIGYQGYDGGETDEGAVIVCLGSSSGIPSGNQNVAAAFIDSDVAGANLGGAVAAAGDVNGDGHADLIAGARSYANGQGGEGAAMIMLGAAGGIAGSPAILEGGQTSAFIGWSVAAAGDVNGDGFGDVIVGAHVYDAGTPNEGAAFVYLGGPNGIASGDPAAASAQLESNLENSQFAWSVAGAGDVNGDGYDDVIVGAPVYGPFGVYHGAAYVFHGGPGGVADGNPATAAASLTSTQTLSGMGRSVSSAGDVNRDGYADVIVGADLYNGTPPLADEGRAFVFLGGPAGITSANETGAAATLAAAQASALLGTSVACAGDVNSDGYDDVIVGAPDYDNGSTNEGAAFVFHGGPGGVTSGNPATADAILESNQASSSMGFSVAGAGDVDGDGYSDVIVGAYRHDLGQSDEGAAFVFRGGASGVADGNPVTAATTLESNQPPGFGSGASFGYSVDAAGDVNGDGYGDVIVGAYLYDGTSIDEGLAVVFLGGPSGVASGNPATAASALRPSGQWRFGQSLAGAGDVNGDGYADVIVGAPSFSQGHSSEGAAFVYLGGGNAGRSFAGGSQVGRRLFLRQVRPGGLPLQPWCRSHQPDAFNMQMLVSSPAGRERSKLETEACPPGVPFGHPSCVRAATSSWVDMPSGGGFYNRIVSGLTQGQLARWRIRALFARSSVSQPGITPPPLPSHGPWRRLSGQAVEGDVRIMNALTAVEDPIPATGLAIRSLFPNPTAGTLTVTLGVPFAGTARIEIHDVAGRRVLARELGRLSPGNHTTRLIETGRLDPGIYVVRLTQAGQSVATKVLVMK